MDWEQAYNKLEKRYANLQRAFVVACIVAMFFMAKWDGARQRITFLEMSPEMRDLHNAVQEDRAAESERQGVRIRP